jgi:type VI secretion system protein ImpJ
MKNLNRVVWSKGMFLTPQHFQLQDRFLQDLLQFRFSASSFANWGVTELRIDAESLANGTFRVDRCRGILPDGMAFEIPETDEAPPSRPILDNHFPPTTQSLDVYLAIAEHRDHSDTITIPPSNHDDAPLPPVTTRYLAETRQIADEIGGVEEKAVQIARPRFRLLFESEPLEGYTSLRIAQVHRDRAGVYILNPRYVTPCLDITSSEYLMNLLRRQVEVLSSRAKELGKRRQVRGQAEFSATEICYSCSTPCPPAATQSSWKVRRGHPETT